MRHEASSSRGCAKPGSLSNCHISTETSGAKMLRVRFIERGKVTVDDKWAQTNPCYFCDNCYYLLHYKDGSLLYSDFCVRLSV